MARTSRSRNTASVSKKPKSEAKEDARMMLPLTPPIIHNEQDRVNLHRCRFVEWKPETICDLAVSPAGSRPMAAAVQGRDGIVMLYDISQNWAARRLISARNIQTILWLNNEAVMSECKHKGCSFNLVSKQVLPLAELESMPEGVLVTGDLQGRLALWCPSTSAQIVSLELNGGAIWSMAIVGNLLAAACEDGRVRLLYIEHNRLVLQKAVIVPFDAPQTRLLSVAVAPDASIFAVGTSEGTIVIHDTASGRVLHRMQLAAHKQSKEAALVWTLKFATTLGQYKKASISLLSGTSTGELACWDTRTGTMLGYLHSHEADILTIAVHPMDNSMLFVTGVDQRLIHVTLRPGSTKRSCLTKVTSRSYHSHDVRASAFVPIMHSTKLERSVHWALVTAGVDGNLVLADAAALATASPADCTIYRRISAYPQQSPLHLAPSARILMGVVPFERNHSVNLWRLASSEPLRDQAALSLQIKGPKDAAIVNASISEDAALVAYSTSAGELRLYSLSWEAEGEGLPFVIQDVSRVPFELDMAIQQFCFAGQSLILCCHQVDGLFLVKFEIISGKLTETLRWTLEEQSAAVSLQANLSFIAAVHCNGTISLISLKTGKSLSMKYGCAITAMQWLDECCLGVVTADNSIFIEDLTLAEGIKCTRRYTLSDLGAPWTFLPRPITSISLHSSNKLILTSCDLMVTVDPAAILTKMAEELVANGKRKYHVPLPEKRNMVGFKWHEDMEGILFFSTLGRDEAVIVQRDWQLAQHALPAPFNRRRYGGL